MLDIVKRWAAENPQAFVEHDRRSFYEAFETYSSMMKKAVEMLELPGDDEADSVEGIIASKWGALATPTAIKTAEKGFKGPLVLFGGADRQ